MTREAEFSADDREQLLGLVRYRGGVHRGCGYHRSVIDEVIASDDLARHIAYDECPFCAAVAVQERVDGDAERTQFEKAAPGVPRPSDGRTTYVTIGPAPGHNQDDDESGGGV